MTVFFFNTDEITMTKSNHTLDNINDKLKGDHKVEKEHMRDHWGELEKVVVETYSSNTLNKCIKMKRIKQHLNT